MAQVLARLYVALMRIVFQRMLIPCFASAQRIADGRAQWLPLLKAAHEPNKRDDKRNDEYHDERNVEYNGEFNTKNRRPRIWWHAASVGELEILWPVMIRIAEEARANSPEFVITILSESANERLGKLVRALESLGIQPVFEGYSPWEGDWGQALRSLKPDLFVTSKYEAWPELWMSLGELGIPLSIVSAKDRKSLRTCRAICGLIGARLPHMSLLTAIQEDAQGLKDAFPLAQVEVAGEPRWDQVWNRAQAGNARAKEIAVAMIELPKPWGVLGSAWPEDVALWKNILREIQVGSQEAGFPQARPPQKAAGSVLIVPHRVDAEHLQTIEEVLKQAGVRYLKTADFGSAEQFRASLESRSDCRCILVNEMGFLAELYSVADWAYIGGGIGRRGVHSTIEPAIHGIPICCGSYRAHQFVEVGELASTGQLRIVKTEDDLRGWLGGLEVSFQRERWKADAKRRLGATERIVQRIVSVLGAC